MDLLLTILPFEKDWFLGHGVTNVEYVGSPLAREVQLLKPNMIFAINGLDPNKPIVSLLPGSRQKEIARILPVMIEAANLMNRENTRKYNSRSPAASTSARKQIQAILERSAIPNRPDRFYNSPEGETYNLLNASDAAAVTSGTATTGSGNHRDADGNSL